MSTLKIRKIGSSLGAIFPKETLHELDVKEGDTIYMVKEESGVYRISSFEPGFEDQMKAFEKGYKRYKKALKELSKK